MTVALYTPYCTATISGVAVDTAKLVGARVESSFVDPVSKGYLRCISDPGFAQGDEVTIALGSGQHNQTRFRGSVVAGDWSNSGPTFDLTCYGPMWLVQKYRNNRPNGITLADLTGGPAADEDIARAVLDIVGVSYDPGHIGGTGIVRGESAAVGYTWRQGETALDYLQRLTKASLGYKMVESTDFNIHRVQILGEPSGSLEHTLTEGVHIFEGGRTRKSTIETYSAWQVTGFNYGDGLGAVTFTYPDPIPDGTVPLAFSSEMIERDTDADPRPGISAETVLGFIRSETDHTLIRLSGISTPRDELFGPGQRHHISASGMLGVDQDVMCVGVTVEADDKWFVQTLEYVG
jgi:hypothetical protein